MAFQKCPAVVGEAGESLEFQGSQSYLEKPCCRGEKKVEAYADLMTWWRLSSLCSREQGSGQQWTE